MLLLLLLGCGGDRAPGTELRLRGPDAEVPAAPGEATVAPETVRAWADQAYRSAAFDSARGLYERALVDAWARADSGAVAGVLTALGNTNRQLGDYDRARRDGEEALALKLRLGLVEQLFDSYNALGLLAREQDRLLEAKSLFGSAMQASQGAHDTVRAKVINNLALVLQDFGEFPEARRLFQDAAGAAGTHGNRRIEGRSLNNLAVLENEVGRPQRALELLTRAGPLLSDDRVGQNNWLGQMGTVMAKLGQAGRAIFWLDSALRRSRALENPQEEASNLEQLADLHWLAGDGRRALELLVQAQALNHELERTVYLGIDLRREAEFDAELGNKPAAVGKALEALETHRRAGTRLEELADLLLLAELSKEAGQLREARAHLAAAERVADGLAAPTALAAYGLSAAHLAEAEARPREALRLLDASAASLTLAGNDMIWRAELTRSRALAGIGDLRAAAEAGRRALASVERIRGSFGSGLLRTSYQSRREDVYSHLVHVLLRLRRVEEAFEVADAGRGGALQEHLATARPEGGKGASGEAADTAGPSLRELAEEERKLLARIDSVSLALQAVAVGQAASDRAELGVERTRLSGELERTRGAYEMALIRAAERAGPGSPLLGGGGRATAVRAALEPGEVLLEYLVTPAQIILFVARKDSLLSMTVEVGRETLRAKVRIGRELIARPAPRAGAKRPALESAALTDLFGLLIQPAIESGALDGTRRLLIVPHAELQYLPFAALKNPRSGRFLVEDFSLIHLPASAALPMLRTRAGGRVPSGQVALAPFPDELPGTLREVAAFEQANARSRIRRGARATEAALREALQRDAVVHVATHGVLSVHNPMFSRVDLARGHSGRTDDDGRLEVHEVLGLSAVSQLVFLSGCETGAGAAWSTAFDPGEDYATLARSFLYSGVRNVVGTLWRIEDEGAAAFATEFYRVLASRPPAEALAEAQRRMLAQGRYTAPFYWAGYRLDGAG